VAPTYPEIHESIDDLRFSAHAVEGQERVPNAIGMVVPQVPHALGRRATSVPLDQVGVKWLQDFCRESKRADHLELRDVAQQALEANAPWLAAETKERAAFAAVAKELVESSAHASIELREHMVEDALLALTSNGTYEALEAPACRPFHLRASEPLVDPLVEGVIVGLTRECVREQPAAKCLPRSLVEGPQKNLAKSF
jgi:hypothetical protein